MADFQLDIACVNAGQFRLNLKVLPPGKAVYLGAEFPVLLRGLYYEGWHPRQRSAAPRDREGFLTCIHESLHRDPGIDADHVARSVFALLAERISMPEIEDLRAACPEPLQGLWPH